MILQLKTVSIAIGGRYAMKYYDYYYNSSVVLQSKILGTEVMSQPVCQLADAIICVTHGRN